MYQVSVRLVQLFPIAQRCVIRVNCAPGISMEDLLQLDDASFIQLLKKYCKPVDQFSFAKTMRQCVNFPQVKYPPTLCNMTDLVTSTSVYAHNFMQMFQFLDSSDASIVPVLYQSNLSSLSLISLFLDMFPNGFGKLLHHKFYKNSFAAMADYVEDFLSNLRTYQSEGRKLAEMNTVLTKFNGPRESNHVSAPSRLQAIASKCHNPTSPVVYDDTSVFEYGAIDVHAMDTYNGNDLQVDIAKAPDNEAPDVKCDEFDADFIPNCSYLEDCDNNDLHPHTDVPGSLAAIQNSKFAFACRSMVEDNRCTKDSCGFSHDPKVVTAARDLLTQKLAKLKSPTIMTRPQNEPPARHPLDRSNEVKPSFPARPPPPRPASKGIFNINALLPYMHAMDVNPDEVPLTRVHVSAQLNCAGNFQPAMALLDTGAVQANYMSTEYFTRNLPQLEPFSTPISASVVLGDGVSVRTIDRKVSLPVTFNHHGRQYHLNLVFLVFDSTFGSQDIIIGLPTLLGQGFYLLMDVLIHARIHGQQACSGINLLTSAPYDEDLELMLLYDAQGPLMKPFSNPLVEAPEELQVPAPVNFESFLNFMETPYPEALQDYINSIATHCNADMLMNTSLFDLLNTKGRQVFCPTAWTGIKDIVIELDWKAAPPRKKLTPRSLNPQLVTVAKTEFDRLLHYMYEYSDSEVVSPLVIAPKATSPFVRLCGSYVLVNKFIEVGHWPIPHVQKSLEKISTFKVFLDLDLANSFHQFRLGELTSKRLSIVTPWGQVRPLFLPEGVGPASFILQKHLSSIF